MDYIAFCVAKYLKFNMFWILDVFFNVNTRIAKRLGYIEVLLGD